MPFTLVFPEKHSQLEKFPASKSMLGGQDCVNPVAKSSKHKLARDTLFISIIRLRLSMLNFGGKVTKNPGFWRCWY